MSPTTNEPDDMSMVNNQGAEDWELGDAIPIPLDLDDEPEDEPDEATWTTTTPPIDD